ncbi:MAG: hypothetical protein U5J63_15205 [Fodinibius sp.]|nr:hypothetical protein [Fodinibius sp.]
MRFLFWTAAILIAVTACNPSSNNVENPSDQYQNFVTLQEPTENSQSVRIYIDSVQTIAKNDKTALLISGTFPDACTKLGDAYHHTKDNTLHLELSGWRTPDTMCAQVLTPFSYIYDKIKIATLTNHSQIIINKTAYSY